MAGATRSVLNVFTSILYLLTLQKVSNFIAYAAVSTLIMFTFTLVPLTSQLVGILIFSLHGSFFIFILLA